MTKIECFPQDEMRTCGLACLRTVLNYYGLKTTENELENLYLTKMRSIKDWGYYASDLALITLILNKKLGKNFNFHLFSKLKSIYGPSILVKNYAMKNNYCFETVTQKSNFSDLIKLYLFEQEIPIIVRTTIRKYYKTKELGGRGHFLTLYGRSHDINVCDPLFRLKPHLIKDEKFKIKELEDLISILIVID